MTRLLALLALSAATTFAAEPPTITLWPQGAPEKPDFKPAEPETAVDKGDGIMRVSHVAAPAITVYQAPNPNGTAVLVCPGGGYNILAIEHEGTAVCQWLNTMGITGVVLKYRVPRRDPVQPHAAPLQDAQRAMGILRKRAAEWQIKPDRIGILGFSAGGNLCVMTALHSNERTYPHDPALEADDARPNFAVPVYPAYIVEDKGPLALKPEIVVDKQSPPMCLIHAHDDKLTAAASALIYVEYRKLEIPAELHIFSKGGHGFGMKQGTLPANQWHLRCGEWLRSMGWAE